jgi:DNA-binding NarL/FixJ family response regulator
MSAVKRVFILCGSSLFGEGVRQLLGRTADLEIVGFGSDLRAAIESIRELQPDVVILDQDLWPNEPGSELVLLREGRSETRYVGLSLAANTLRRYWSEARTVQRGEDLVEAIQ